MDSTPSSDQIAHEYLPYFRAYKDGRIERHFGSDRVPASVSESNNVATKDIVISTEPTISARIFLPQNVHQNPIKLPLLVYFHGGGFFMGSSFCSAYHNYITSVVSAANVVSVSIDYRLAPEHHIPAAYDDSCTALKWVFSHAHGLGPESWLNDFGDFDRVFLAGDSAGGNIVYNLGIEGMNGGKIRGICLIHPYFGRRTCGVDRFWGFVYPDNCGFEDYRINPNVGLKMWRLACDRVLVCLAEKDEMRERGLFFCECLRESEWVGDLEVLESEGEEHVFHLLKPECEKSLALMDKLASFLND